MDLRGNADYKAKVPHGAAIASHVRGFTFPWNAVRRRRVSTPNIGTAVPRTAPERRLGARHRSPLKTPNVRP
jgi:hypothetical protein